MKFLPSLDPIDPNVAYDLIVVGDEPGGVWLLSELLRLKGAKGQRGFDQRFQKIAWLRLHPETTTTSYLIPDTGHFTLAGGIRSVPIEIATPSEVIPWNEKVIRERFPNLPSALRLRPTSRDLNLIRFSLREQPEILKFASALWRVSGRTESLQSESLIWAALLCSRILEWTPSIGSEIPSAILDEDEVVTQISLGKVATLHLKTPLRSRVFLFNMTWRDFLRIVPDSTLRSRISCQIVNPTSKRREIPLLIQTNAEATQSANQRSMRGSGVTVLVDTDEIPLPYDEMWPVYWNKEGWQEEGKLRMSVSVAPELSLEMASEKMRTAYSRFQNSFPWMDTLSVYPPLDVESCACAEKRNEALTFLENHQKELYSLVQIELRSPSKGFYQLLPSYRSFLPYPLGVFQGAQQILTDLLGRGVSPKARSVDAPRNAMR